MRSSLYLTLALSLGLAACTNSPAGRENANPDADVYYQLKTEKQWRNFISERENDLTVACRDSNRYYYDYSNCFSDESATLGQLNKRQEAWKRYIAALKAASVSGKFSKVRMEDYRENAERLETNGKYFAQGYKRIQERRAKQDKIIADLNKTSCKVTRSQSDIDSELVLTGCDPATTQDPYNVAGLLERLEQVSVRADRDALSNSYRTIRNLTPKYQELARIKETLIASGTVTVNGEQLTVNGAGNPFYGIGELEGLTKYGQLVDEIAASLGLTEKCSGPCDRAFYKMSSALNANPMKSFCDSHSDSYGYNIPDASFLKTWFTMNDAQQLSNLGLTFSPQNRGLYSERSSSSDRLTFTDILKDQGITVSLPYTRLNTVCPQPAPYFFFFQESEALAKFVRSMDTQNSRYVTEIRWFASDRSSSLNVRAYKASETKIVLEVPYLELSRQVRSASQVRDQIYSQIPSVLAGAR